MGWRKLIRETKDQSNEHGNISDDMRINAAYIHAGLGIKAQYTN